MEKTVQIDFNKNKTEIAADLYSEGVSSALDVALQVIDSYVGYESVKGHLVERLNELRLNTQFVQKSIDIQK
jgi:hypothetical protein